MEPLEAGLKWSDYRIKGELLWKCNRYTACKASAKPSNAMCLVRSLTPSADAAAGYRSYPNARLSRSLCRFYIPPKNPFVLMLSFSHTPYDNDSYCEYRLLDLAIVGRSINIASTLMTVWIDGLPEVGAILVMTRLVAET